MKPILLVIAATLATAAQADEGMWTFDNVPKAAIKARYGVDVTDPWLAQLRLASVRLDNGCSASFVSKSGLVLTNHHCVESCIAQNSSAERNLLADGFTAANREQEIRCQGAQASVLVGTEDVTAQVAAATAGLAPAEAVTARNRALTGLEQACEEAAKNDKATGPLKCQAVTLYQGGQHWIYRYKRYEDVRLVFAPERAIAAFGGDPDNFQFPRWCLDMALLRVYEGGKPAATPNRLAFNWRGAEPGEPVFVSGHPGSTQRLMTVAELETERNTFLPFWLLRVSELRGRLIQFGKTDAESQRRAEDLLYSVENSIKVRRKQLDALLDDSLFARKRTEESALRAAVAGNPALAEAGGAWDAIAAAQRVRREILVPHTFIENSAGFNSALYRYAVALVRAADERTRPNGERLREFTEARLPALEAQLNAALPVYPDLERATLSYSLERMREWLGPDDALVRSVFGADSADSLAARLVDGSKLADPAVRMALYQGGQAAIAASTDPMIVLARSVDPVARALRKRMEDEVDGPVKRGQELISKARFATYGTSLYPDATFTLRLSYGAVQPFNEGERVVGPYTQLARAYERATGADPFRLPQRWLDAKPRLDLGTRANFTTTNDIIGGNSGSPMVNAKGEIVGLAFDGNIHSISGAYWFDEQKNRTIGVHTAFMRLALEQVYDARHLLAEIDARR